MADFWHRFRSISRTLRFRLAAWNALVVAVIALVMLLGLRQGIRWALYHEMDMMLLDEAREISLVVQDAGADDFQVVRDDLQRKSLGHQPHSWFAALFDVHGNLVWSSEENDIAAGPIGSGRNLLPYTVSNRRVVEMQIADNPLGIRDVRVGASLVIIHQDIALIDRLMTMAAGMLVLIAPVCGYWLAGRASRTLGDIIQTASRLRPSHLDERLKVQGTGDELDQLSHTINGLLDRIGSYLQMKGDFLANAAHELRTPLAAIRTSIEVTLSKDRTVEEYENVLEELINQAITLETLVNQLLLLSETESIGSIPWDESDIPLHEVVRRAADMFQGVAETREIELRLETIDEAFVLGNRPHLRQVVNNLLDNAIKYTAAGGTVRVNLVRLKQEQTVKLTVEDNGIGISAEDVRNVFNRFFRADRSRSRSLAIHGSGLGLSICQAVVNAHGGSIHCRSVLHSGTIMEVILPLAPQRAEKTASETEDGETSNAYH